MGLSLEVGILADLIDGDPEGYQSLHEEFQKLQGWLATQGLSHNEPASLGSHDIFSCSMIGYSGLHTLRRVAAHLQFRKILPPPGDFRTATKDPEYSRYYNEAGRGGSYDHLMLHSDAEGYYLPCKFKRVLFPPEELDFLAGSIGSSPVLLEECLALAHALEMPLGLDPESLELDVLFDRAKDASGWQRYPAEVYCCLQLIVACRASITTGAAIVFT